MRNEKRDKASNTTSINKLRTQTGERQAEDSDEKLAL